ncbi:acyl-CoA dehydrogenase [Rhizorhabdus wittichii DC-6]|nr:acyl-CoA dehydrogenase [Rhizorhabdus wittichii DC-6]
MHDRKIYNSDHEMFRASARRFFREEVEANILQWESDGIVPRSFWKKAGAQGLLCCGMPEEYGGPGADFFYNIILSEEGGYGIGSSSLGIFMQSDIVAYYLLKHASEELKRRWLPAMVTGEAIGALGMTEPSCGSDLKALRTTARREGDEYVISGQKTFITNGQNCDFIVLACKTDPAKGAKGISLILVEADRPGFERGRNLDKIGQKSSDTSELFFSDVRVPVGNRLGEEGRGFAIMMEELPRERLTIASRALGESQRAFELTVEYAKERQAFGQRIMDFQNTQFTLADIRTSLALGWAFHDQCLAKIGDGTLMVEEAAMIKLWATENNSQVMDKCLQLFGGYGYMTEYPISRFYVDSRVRRIFGGSSEVCRMIIGRSL